MAEAKTESEMYMEKLKFADKKNVASTALSGGMKRKLHLGMALIGPSDVRSLASHYLVQYKFFNLGSQAAPRQTAQENPAQW